MVKKVQKNQPIEKLQEKAESGQDTVEGKGVCPQRGTTAMQ